MVESLVSLAYEARYTTRGGNGTLDEKFWLVRVYDTRGRNNFLWYEVPISHPGVEAVVRRLDDVAGGPNRIFKEP